MTSEELLKLAVALAEAEEHIYCFNICQTPADPEERIKQRAAFKIVQSQLKKAQDEYDAAIAGYTGDELRKIMRGES